MKKAIQLCFILLMAAISLLSVWYAFIWEEGLPFGLPPLLLSSLAMAALGAFILFEYVRWLKAHPEQKSKGLTFALLFGIALSLALAVAAIVF